MYENERQKHTFRAYDAVRSVCSLHLSRYNKSVNKQLNDLMRPIAIRLDFDLVKNLEFNRNHLNNFENE